MLSTVKIGALAKEKQSEERLQTNGQRQNNKKDELPDCSVADDGTVLVSSESSG